MDPLQMSQSVGNMIPGALVCLFIIGIGYSLYLIYGWTQKTGRNTLESENKALKLRAEKAEKELEILTEPAQMVLLPMNPTLGKVAMADHISAHKASLRSPVIIAQRLNDHLAEQRASLNVLSNASGSFANTKKLKGMTYSWHALPEILNRLADEAQKDKGPIHQQTLAEEKGKSLLASYNTLRDQNAQQNVAISEKDELIATQRNRIHELELAVAMKKGNPLAIQNAEMSGRLKVRDEESANAQDLLKIAVARPQNQSGKPSEKKTAASN